MMERYRSSHTDIFASLQRRIIALENQTELIRAANVPIKWIAPSLGNSWANVGGAYATAGYMRDTAGVVHLKGRISSGTLSTIFTLPVGFRPAATRTLTVVTNSGIGHITVEADGDVIAVAGGNTWFSLDGVSFPAEQ